MCNFLIEGTSTIPLLVDQNETPQIRIFRIHFRHQINYHKKGVRLLKPVENYEILTILINIGKGLPHKLEESVCIPLKDFQINSLRC